MFFIYLLIFIMLIIPTYLFGLSHGKQTKQKQFEDLKRKYEFDKKAIQDLVGASSYYTNVPLPIDNYELQSAKYLNRCISVVKNRILDKE